ncbi:MAG: TetR/AcrR family transcriptional regulator [Acidimicrobiales bacterium]
MRRDTAQTRDRLLVAAQRLFATRGIFRTTIREITEEAGQRNTSAVSYHFGSRGGLLEALLVQRGVPLDHERGELLTLVGPDPTTRELLAVLLTPLIGCLDTHEGRCYLRIVVQLTGQFAQWRDEAPMTGPNLRLVLAELEHRPVAASTEARDERLIALIMLLTTVMAERARQIDDGGPLPIDEWQFEANLLDMLVGIVDAPATAPVDA